MRAFVFIELVAGIVILGVISIACSKILLELRKKEQSSYYLGVNMLNLESGLLQVEHLLENAKGIRFDHNILSFESEGRGHNLSLKSNILSLDGYEILSGIKSFRAYGVGMDWVIEMCGARKCFRRVVLIYGDE